MNIFFLNDVPFLVYYKESIALRILFLHNFNECQNLFGF